MEYADGLDSPTADLRNVGPDGAPDGLVAAVFMRHFVGDVPWAHIDIAGTAWSERDAGWCTRGCTGFGTRTLIETARGFATPV